jgi:hypothetical protein
MLVPIIEKKEASSGSYQIKRGALARGLSFDILYSPQSKCLSKQSFRSIRRCQHVCAHRCQDA